MARFTFAVPTLCSLVDRLETYLEVMSYGSRAPSYHLDGDASALLKDPACGSHVSP